MKYNSHLQSRPTLRSWTFGLLGIAAALSLAMPAAAQEGGLKKIQYGFATKSISTIATNFVIPGYLGYYEEEGLDPEILPLGSNPAVMGNLQAGRIDLGVGVPSFQLPLVAKDEELPAINYFEYTYPFKWDIAVEPDSDIKSIADLKGKTLGVSNFGNSEYPVGKILMDRAGLDPENDVTWLAVGDGVTAGRALENGDIDALVYYDTGFGTIEGAGIEMRYLELPENIPQVGGLYIAAPTSYLEENRDVAVGFARAVAKAQIFIQENPEAAAWIFLQTHPEAGIKAASVEEQVKALVNPISKRSKLFSPYDESVPMGFIKESEWHDEIVFNDFEGQVEDVSQFFTNDLIEEINDFDKEAIRKQAREFELPYKD